MKEELSQKLIESLDKVQEYVEATEGFVVEQAPLIAQEIITLGRVNSVYMVSVAAFFLLLSIGIFYTCWRRINGNCGYSECHEVMSILSGTSSAFFAFLTCFLVQSLFEPWFAPRVYLLHEIGKLL